MTKLVYNPKTKSFALNPYERNRRRHEDEIKKLEKSNKPESIRRAYIELTKLDIERDNIGEKIYLLKKDYETRLSAFEKEKKKIEKAYYAKSDEIEKLEEQHRKSQ